MKPCGIICHRSSKKPVRKDEMVIRKEDFEMKKKKVT